MVFINGAHILSMIACIFREIQETNMESSGKFYKILEVLGTMSYIMVVINCLQIYDKGLKWKALEPSDTIPPCLTDASLRIEWAGATFEWCLLEIAIYFSYMYTLIVLLVKSRFTVIGVDQTTQFEPK